MSPLPRQWLPASWLSLVLAVSGCTSTPEPPGEDSPGDSDTSSPSLSGTLSGVSNPSLVTEVIVSGVLDAPAQLELQCTADVDSPLEERHVLMAESATDRPSFVLRGLLADTAYECVAVDLQAPGGATYSVEFTTGSLPAALQDAVIEQVNWDRDHAVNGYFLMDLGRFVDASTVDHFVVVLDMMGQVRWYYAVEGTDGTLSVEYVQERGAFLIGAQPLPDHNPALVDLSGTTLGRVDSFGHHDAIWLDEGVLNITPKDRGVFLEQHGFDDGDLVWSLTPDDVPRLDSVGFNAVKVVEEAAGRSVYASSQQEPLILKVDYDTRALEWIVGPRGDFALPEDQSWFDWTHDMHPVACEHDVCLLFYDNGVLRGYSQVSLLALDESSMTAQYLRTWTEPGWSEHIYGGIQELPGGAWLLSRGHVEELAPTSLDTALIQILPDDSTPWRLVFTPSEWTLYRARWIDGSTLFANVGYGYTPVR